MRISELTNKFYKFLPEIRNAIYDELVEADYYRERSDKTQAKWRGSAGVIGFLLGGAVIYGFTFAIVWFAPAALIIAVILTVVILFFFAQIMPARTVEGARAREAALGFKEFLSRVKKIATSG